MSVISVHKNNFQSEVLQSSQPVLRDFWAPGCAPCRMLSPIVEDVAAGHPEIKVGKVNVDEEPELAAQFGVMGIPALFYLKEGQVVSSAVGAQPKARVEALLK